MNSENGKRSISSWGCFSRRSSIRTATILSICIIGSGGFFPRVAAAQLYECNGTFTNKPCADGTAPVERRPTVSVTVSDDPGRAEKRSLLHEFTMKTIRAREDYDIRTDLTDAERACVKESGPVESCREVLQAMDRELDERIAHASIADEQRRANKLQEEANDLQRERNEIEANKPDVVVVEQQPVYVIPHDRRRHPGFHEGGAGVSVNATGQSGNTTIQVGTSAGFSQRGENSLRPKQNALRPGPQPTVGPGRVSEELIIDRAGKREMRKRRD